MFVSKIIDGGSLSGVRIKNKPRGCDLFFGAPERT